MKINFRKIRKNTKALSPVIAAIILIAVTVAVSVAVAAWMGALTFGFTATEQVSITNVQADALGTTLTISVRNSGSSSVVITNAYVNGQAPATMTSTAYGTNADGSITVLGNSNGDVTVTLANAVQSGSAYQVKLLSAKGNSFIYTFIA